MVGLGPPGEITSVEEGREGRATGPKLGAEGACVVGAVKRLHRSPSDVERERALGSGAGRDGAGVRVTGPVVDGFDGR